MQLNKEEKILLSLQHQEYDALRMIESFNQLIPDKTQRENNELYKFKLEQFKQMSNMRAEQEKLMIRQNILRTKHNFQNYGLQMQADLQEREFEDLVERTKIINSLREIQEYQSQEGIQFGDGQEKAALPSQG